MYISSSQQKAEIVQKDIRAGAVGRTVALYLGRRCDGGEIVLGVPASRASTQEAHGQLSRSSPRLMCCI